MIPLQRPLIQALLLCVSILPLSAYAAEPTSSSSVLPPSLEQQAPTPPTELTAAFTAPEYVELDKKAFFDASTTVLVPDAPGRILYRWDFGDGTPAITDREVLHSFTTPGDHTVRLRVTQGDRSSETEKRIFIFDRRAILITDGQTLSALNQIRTQAAEKGVLLTDISNIDGETGFITEEQLVQKIQERGADIAPADLIVFYTRSSIGLQAFTRYFQALDPEDRFDPKTKLFVKISEENLNVAAPTTQQAFGVIAPRFILLTRPESLAPLLEEKDPALAVATLTSRGIEYRIIDERSDHTSYFVLSRMVSGFIAYGVPSNIIYLLLAFPFAAFCVAFFRQVIGGATFGVYIPSMLAVAFLIIGAPLGLFVLAVVLVVSYLTRLVLARIDMLYIPRIALLFSLIALSLFGVMWTMLYLGTSVAISLAVFPMLMMSTISEKYLSMQNEEGFKSALLVTGQTVALSVVIFYLLSWRQFAALLLSFPELALLPLVALFILGRFTGLKLTEYVRFRSLLKEPGEEE